MTQVSVLIDLHQQRKNNFETIQISDTEWRQPQCQRRTEPQNNNPQHPLSLMIEQINIALEQKGPGISQPGSLKPAVGDQRQKESICIN